MSIDNAIASLAVKRLDAVVAWYTELFGRAADSMPMARVAEWKFPRGGWLQVYELAERAGNGSVTLAVSDLEDVSAHLEKLRIDTTRRTRSEKANTLTIADPDGNLITFAEALDPSMAR